MRGKFALLLASLLLLGVFNMSVTAPSTSTKTIDGDPSDWIGVPGADNTWVVSAGEGIWRDLAFDDTGNGSYIYPNVTHGALIDSGGPPWDPDHPLAYTDKFGGLYPDPWYKHGGMVDLREFRVTADDEALYMLFRFENMGSFDNAVEWNYWVHDPTWGWDANATGWGKVKIEVYIDMDRVYGSGNTTEAVPLSTGPPGGNFLIDPSAAWEEMIDIQGDNRRFGYANWPVPPAYIGSGLPRVIHRDGTETLLNQSSGPGTPTIYTRGNANIYPSAIEMKVPYWALGGADPRGQTWRFTVVVGGSDEGYWRQVWNTSLAQEMVWPQWFRFAGGEGGDSWTAYGLGNDPNIIDMAFTPDQATQEAILNNFTKSGSSSLAVIKAYQDVTFWGNGDVRAPGVGGAVTPLDKLALWAPWIALVTLVTVAAASVAVYSKKRIAKTI